MLLVVEVCVWRDVCFVTAGPITKLFAWEGGWDPWGTRYFNTGCAWFPWFLSCGNRTQNSRVAGARPNHQADRGSHPNHRGIWSPPRAGHVKVVGVATSWYHNRRDPQRDHKRPLGDNFPRYKNLNLRFCGKLSKFPGVACNRRLMQSNSNTLATH